MLVSDLRETAKNRLVMLPGHFAHPVRVDSVEEIGAGFFLLKVRDSSGHLDETQVTGEELESALAEQGSGSSAGRCPGSVPLGRGSPHQALVRA